MLDVDEVIPLTEEQQRDGKGVGTIHGQSRNTLDQGGASYHLAPQQLGAGLMLPHPFTQGRVQDGQGGR